MDGGETNIISKTEDSALYTASQNTPEKLKTITMAELESQGWDALEALLVE